MFIALIDGGKQMNQTVVKGKLFFNILYEVNIDLNSPDMTQEMVIRKWHLTFIDPMFVKSMIY